MDRSALIENVDRFPASPGVYLMKDNRGSLLYVGKSSNLRSRVKSYFSDDHAERPHIPVMLAKLAAIEWIATQTEAEALILEANLVRTHSPPYNVELRDDKHYPYLKVTLSEPFPRLLVVRRVEDDGSRYFGPYTDVKAMRRLVGFAKRIFRIRDCSLKLPLARPRRPCINHAMGRCSAPCAGLVDEAAYRRGVDDLCRFLRGRRNELLTELQQRMEQAAVRQDYEQAALLRDQVRLIADAGRLQRVDLRVPEGSLDVFGVHEGATAACVSVLQFREGLLLSTSNFLVRGDTWQVSAAGRESAVAEYYLQSADDLPAEVLLSPAAAIDQAALQAWFDSQKGPGVNVEVPQRGEKRHLVALAEKNADLYLAERAPEAAGETLGQMQQLLNLPEVPAVIEAFDISNMGGSFAVAGMVRFVDGVPDKSQYRRYKIVTVEGQNDFAMLMEAISRRLTRLQAEHREFPRLLLIDGGKGQLSSARKVLERFEHAPAVVSLAKEEETLFSPYTDGPLQLPATHPVRRLVERIRDEVHRTAIGYHRNLRGRQFRHSELESLPGIGPGRSSALLRRFGSLRKLREASVKQIAEVEGFSEAMAERVRKQLDAAGPR